MNEEAAETAEEATDLIGWVLNHGRLRSVFNECQAEAFGKVLAFLVANETRWGTHFVAFDRFSLKNGPSVKTMTQQAYPSCLQSLDMPTCWRMVRM